jgi:hypothetical protein
MVASNLIYATDRIQQIAEIMPEFCNVARVGDEIVMGLEGDRAFPFSPTSRPSAVITGISDGSDGKTVSLRMNDGTSKQVNQHTISPAEVFEFTDKSFEKVLQREKDAAMQTYRAEKALEEPRYAGIDELQSLRNELKELSAMMESERQLNRNFHNTYIMTMKQVTDDLMEMDKEGNKAQFCRTFNREYMKMENRAEEAVFRGSGPSANDVPKTGASSNDVTFRGQQELEDDNLSEYSYDGGVSEFF